MVAIVFGVLLTICLISTVFMEYTVRLMGTDTSNGVIMAFGLFNLSIDSIPCGVSRYLIYNKQDKEALSITLKYYLGRLPIAVLLALCIKDESLMLITTSILFLYYP